ncbi:leucine-rich repeat-containing G-protein coupled receptor 6 [Narcine bancroftii]|uniref:leucine-rich repeat-containing G-protein coupled receptor 6 n=1 Tax=Narcine bancroftii TaxID=1343680 RepID=UPI0038311AD7
MKVTFGQTRQAAPSAQRRMSFPCSVLFLAALGYECGSQAPPSSACPPLCHCEEDGILQWVDCSELGLEATPEDLSPLTSYLDLSMNNINDLQPNSFEALHFLEELRLSGNHLAQIPIDTFTGLYNLKVLMLQNNQLKRLPNEALWNLPNLQSLRLDANLISDIPQNSFKGLQSLRHLWLDDNALTQIPVQALNNLPSLQAMTLALNKIAFIPDSAFVNLSSLVVLHLHNNNIQALGKNCFDGLHSLETLDLNYNDLAEFPVAIRTLSKLQELGFHNNNIKAIPEKAFVGNPLLQTIHFYDNPIQFVGKSAFQYLPKLHTLSLNGANELKEFLDLKGTTSLEILTLTRAGITSLPKGLCQQLPNLRVLELSYNQIHTLPSFYNCQKLEEIGLQHNRITEIRADTFQQLMGLRSLDLGWNDITFIHYDAFVSLHSLKKLDLTFNQLSSLPLNGLSGLTHLKLKGNLALSEFFSEESFPQLRVLEMPFAYQCCAYGSCKINHKQDNPWYGDTTVRDDEDGQKRAMGVFPIQPESNYYLHMDDFQLEVEDPKLHPSIQCTPAPGPFNPCDYLFESWTIRLGVWGIVLLSVVCNGLVIVTIFASPGYLAPVKFVIGLIAGANMLTGLYSGTLAIVDAMTFGQFAKHGARWETGLGCRITGFVSVFASEASILFLTLAAVQCSISVSCVRAYGKSPSFTSVKIAAFCCTVLSFSAAALPLCSVGEFGTSPLCLPSPLPGGKSSTLGFMVALIMMNTLCFLVITGAYTKLYCDLMKGEFDSIWDCAMIKHVAWLIFTNCILYCPVAFLTFSSLLNLFPISPDAIKSILLVVLPLPACLNPLLYLLLNPHFKEDLRILRDCKWQKRCQLKQASIDSLSSEDSDKQSCDSTLALMTFADHEIILDSTKSLGVLSSHRQVMEAYPFPPVTLIPCQQRKGKEDICSTQQSHLTDEELLITSEITEQAHSSIQITFYPNKGPSFTSNV